ncbi:MAG: Hpt domain protein [Gemmatimonadetes bacterium]|nr:Hpt domain protein [Gemmatimonadota bacterium]
MTQPAGFLDFFVLEASEYIEQLDGLVLAGAAQGPDAAEVQRIARALRGSATMAKLPSFAELAGSVERVGRALNSGNATWDAALRGALTSAIDELKILVRAARSWTPTEDMRAVTRSNELARWAPVQAAATPAATSAPGSFLAGETSNIAAGLELLLTRPTDGDVAGNLLKRVRALRGVAGLRDVPLLAPVAEAAERAARPLERGDALAPEHITLLRASAELLRALAQSLRDGTAMNPGNAHTQFESALESVTSLDEARERIVPVSELFHDDDQPHVVHAAPNPPTTPGQRFRLEVTAQGENLRRLVSEARSAPATDRERFGREIKVSLRNVRNVAASFGEKDVAGAVQAHAGTSDNLDMLSLNSLDAMAAALASPGANGEHLAAALAQLREQNAFAGGMGAAFGASEPASSPADESTQRLSSVLGGATQDAPPPIPVSPPVPPRPAVDQMAPTPIISMAAIPQLPPMPEPVAQAIETVKDVAAVAREIVTDAVTTMVSTVTATVATSVASTASSALDAGIAAFDAMADLSLAEPVDLDDEPMPIDMLLYRGRAAIHRSIELRDEIRAKGGAPSADELHELYELMDLALAD